MLNRSQNEVMQSWKKDKPCLVSIVCITYNHERFIQEALDSFLMQETDSPFEIIIHDDASTDNTPNIIKKYHSCYPEIIKPILQEENQFSKGGFKPSFYAAGFASGKYIALCEGDDYWISKQKLKIQSDAMEKHPELDLSFHPSYYLRDNVRDKKPSQEYAGKKIVLPGAVFDNYKSSADTCSFMVRREIFSQMPDWFYEIAPVGDYFLELYGSKRGGALNINKALSIYRVNTPNGWSAGMKLGGIQSYRHAKRMLESLQLLKKDFPDYSANIKKKESEFLYSMSIYHLFSRNVNEFNKYIEDSVLHYKYISNSQQLIYMLRSMPRLLCILVKLATRII